MQVRGTASGKPRERWRRRLYLPAYPVVEAARLAEIHGRTVSRWFYGYVTPSGGRARRVLSDRQRGVALSYLQLVEVAFVARFRKLNVSLERIRIAHKFLAKAFGAEYPFAQLGVRTDGADIFKNLESAEGPWVDRLLVASRHGQIAWAEAIEERISQFDWEIEQEFAVRWYPRGKDAPVVVDPQIAFGAPILRDSSIPTAVIKGRFQAGEDIAEIQEDFGVRPEAIEFALAFEGVESFAAVASCCSAIGTWGTACPRHSSYSACLSRSMMTTSSRTRKTQNYCGHWGKSSG